MHTYTYTHTLWVLSPLPPAKDLFFFHLFTPPPPSLKILKSAVYKEFYISKVLYIVTFTY